MRVSVTITPHILLREKDYVLLPQMVLGLILGTINPLTIGITAENQWVYSFCCQS